MRSSMILAAIGAACHAPVAPQPQPQPRDEGLERRVAEYVRPYVAMKDFAGVILIAQGDRVLVRKSFGDAPLDAPYAVGSIGKTVTAAAVEQLAKHGTLQLDAPISRYVSGLPYGERVTIRQLLDHRGGVADYYSFPEFAAHHGESVQLGDLVAVIASKPLDFEPGHDERYSNSGYALLAAAIEQVSGRPYGEHVASEVLAPVGMKSSGDLTAGVPPNLAPRRDPGFPPTGVQPAAALGAGWLIGNGSLYATADDLLRWVRSRTKATIGKEVFGWGLHDHNGHHVLEQDGRISGAAAYVGTALDEGLVVIVLDSIQCQVVGAIANDLFELARGHAVPPPAVRAAADVGAGTLEAYVGRYEAAPGFDVTIAATPGGLTLAGPDGIALPLDRVATASFFFRPLYVPISFQQTGDAPASALVWSGSAFPRVPNH